MARRRRILFFSEAVTLAHVARPSALAASLDPEVFDVAVASAPSHRHYFPSGMVHLGLNSISPVQFAKSLAVGRPLYSAADLRKYVQDDLATMALYKPDLVVGDFRLSLAVSARLAKVPFVGISNAYWSPFAADSRMPMPQLPLTSLMPVPIAELLFRAVLPISMRWHLLPHAQVRREHRLPEIEFGLRQVYTEADEVLHPDISGLFPLRNAPVSHQTIGAIEWSVPTPLPAWWTHLPEGLPQIYVTMGSSGNGAVLAEVLDALANRPLTVLAATAGYVGLGPPPDNVRIADFLPGREAAKHSQLVICNGGSMTCQQALANGVPVLGIVSNMDQFMNMRAIEHAGAGLLLRADRLNRALLADAVGSLLSSDRYRDRARAIAVEMAGQSAVRAFDATLRRLLA